MANNVREFKAKSGEFVRGTRRRVLFELFTLALIAIYFSSSWSTGIPSWLKWSVLAFVVCYIVINLLMYPKSKAIAENFSIWLSDDALAFSDGGGKKELSYRELQISKVKKVNDDVAEIWLRTSFHQTIKLKGLENMRELHEQLIGYLPKDQGGSS